jgi:hypothetical protein
LEVSTPSTVIVPASGFTRRNSAAAIVDLPLPLRPQMPNRSPGFT